MLNQYLQQTTQLLQNPPAPVSLYSTADLTTYINRARLQVAGEAACIRDYSSITFPAGTQKLPFSSIVTTANTGIAGVLNVRLAAYLIASGQRFIRPRNFEWFFLYELNNPVPQQAYPTVWAQQGQGVSGTMWISPAPIIDITFNLDTVCYPIDLVDDTTVEAIPLPWTTAVPFLAAYFALLSAQNGVRYNDAAKMDQEYSKFMQRARSMSTPTANPYLYQQTNDPTVPNKLALGSTGGGQS